MAAPIFTILLIVALLVTTMLVWWWVRPQQAAYVDYKEESPDWNYSFHRYEIGPPINRKNKTLAGQPAEWQQVMKSIGNRMQQKKVKRVVFVHGTFVGNDPWGVLDTIQMIYPSISKTTAKIIYKTIRSSSDKLFRDNGNFTNEYVQLYETALGGQIPAQRFHWSSGNHHAARLKGALNLLTELARLVREYNLTGSDKILVQGHSHAGQLFAIIAILTSFDKHAYRLVEIAEEFTFSRQQIWADVSTLNQLTLDYVTYGTPPIYNWPNTGYYRLINIINHRGSSALAGSLRGILNTADGDYVQQLAILGTDLLASTPEERRINKKLDAVLGEGHNLNRWRQEIGKKMRVPPFGRTFLINYGDNSPLPNFLQSFFGHGVYTRYEAMLFNTSLIAKFFYNWRFLLDR